MKREEAVMVCLDHLMLCLRLFLQKMWAVKVVGGGGVGQKWKLL